jgi:hypothetical protein
MSKKIAIMQPYFFPYIGYFQLINAVDEFVIYDNIEYTKKGWINRNRILVNGVDAFISLPLKKDSDYLHVKERYLSDTWDMERKKMLRRITDSYRNAPYFNKTYELVEKCILYEDLNLFNFIFHSLVQVIKYLQIDTKIIISSTLLINHTLKSDQKIIEICNYLSADEYNNPIGGIKLYNKDYFLKNGIELRFNKSNNIFYQQYKNEFVPWLSIIDIMMFNSVDFISKKLNDYTQL